MVLMLIGSFSCLFELCCSLVLPDKEIKLNLFDEFKEWVMFVFSVISCKVAETSLNYGYNFFQLSVSIVTLSGRLHLTDAGCVIVGGQICSCKLLWWSGRWNAELLQFSEYVITN